MRVGIVAFCFTLFQTPFAGRVVPEGLGLSENMLALFFHATTVAVIVSPILNRRLRGKDAGKGKGQPT